jgi:hypothetical protein
MRGGRGVLLAFASGQRDERIARRAVWTTVRRGVYKTSFAGTLLVCGR